MTRALTLLALCITSSSVLAEYYRSTPEDARQLVCRAVASEPPVRYGVETNSNAAIQSPANLTTDHARALLQESRLPRIDTSLPVTQPELAWWEKAADWIAAQAFVPANSMFSVSKDADNVNAMPMPSPWLILVTVGGTAAYCCRYRRPD